jgi:hypothetical protein
MSTGLLGVERRYSASSSQAKADTWRIEMNLPISVSTENMYKFAAIFGLVMVVAGFWASIQQGKSTNEEVFPPRRK